MPRIAALVVSILVALVAAATPAPEPKPWVTGWDKPVDPKGDCKFERKGERLTITVPGKGHGMDYLAGPHLLRQVEGNFVAEVRVAGDCWSDEEGTRAAGILLMGNEKTAHVRLVFRCRLDDGRSSGTSLVVCHILSPKENTHISSLDQYLPEKSMYLRMERWEALLQISYSEDGKKWKELPKLIPAWKLPRKLKVGVFAEDTAEGEFKAVFDHFKLSRPAN